MSEDTTLIYYYFFSFAMGSLLAESLLYDSNNVLCCETELREEYGVRCGSAEAAHCNGRAVKANVLQPEVRLRSLHCNSMAHFARQDAFPSGQVV